MKSDFSAAASPAFEMSVLCLQRRGVPCVRDVCALYEDRQVGVVVPELTCESQARALPLSFIGEIDVGYDAQDVAPVLPVVFQSLLSAAGQDDLGSAPHPQRLAPFVEGLQNAQPRLLDQTGVHHGKVRGDEVYRVLYQDDYLDIGDGGVVVQVERVLYELDHGQEQRRIPLPVEDLVDGVARLLLESLHPPVVRRRGQDDHRHVRSERLDLPGEGLTAVR